MSSDYLAHSRIKHPKIPWPILIPARKKGDPPRPSPKHRENTAALLDAYGIKVRWNLMRHWLEIDIPDFAPEPERQQNSCLAMFVELCERNGLDGDRSLNHLQFLAHSYHPVYDWILSTPWDGKDRLGDFLAAIQLAPGADLALAGILVERWLTSCVQALLPQCAGERKFAPQGVLTFQGPQGIGKTEFFKSLAPLDSEWISVGRTVDPHSRDSVQQATAFWIVEMGEVDATFRKADMAALKAFITQDTDVYRTAFARREEKVPRRTVLAASVNRRDFLLDETGNRRWWVLSVVGLNWKHGIDMQQLWAQVMHLAIGGAQWWLSADESNRLSESNAAHEVADPLIEDLWDTWRVVKAMSLSMPVRVTMADIWMALPGREHKTRSRSDASTIAKALRDAGAENDTVTKGNATYRVERVRAAAAGGYPAGGRNAGS